MAKKTYTPKTPTERVLEQYQGTKASLTDFTKDGILIRHFIDEDYVWSETSQIWQKLTSGDYVEQLPDGSFRRVPAIEVDSNLKLK